VIEAALYHPGDKVKVVLSNGKWYAASVIKHHPWHDGHGNTMMSYLVEFEVYIPSPYNQLIAGPNSLRPRKKIKT
jgi:hypothetical protein